ncbi:hypothetical protein [Methylobacterium aquaticum]|uniref:Uncharacterized protein n=1 Tax=Methylobacterium aquaticum TaxID=270351 RepID=A0A0J6S524_9HYPH|nr:hypothetical protein [Methylobacterium aquaticum]KMO28548.1 hypothetical protein VP06_27115 [Methylobacterium aquaticum]
MSRTDRQAATAATLANLDAPPPFWPLTTSGRQICDALGRPRLLVLPTADGSADADRHLAAAICRLINEAAGERQPDACSPLDPDHLDAVREETERAGRQMGRRVGGGR